MPLILQSMDSIQIKTSPSSQPVSPEGPSKQPQQQQGRKRPDDMSDFATPALAPGPPPLKKQKHSPSSRASSAIGVTRSISACLRCRLRKTRCDQEFPSCSSCLKANVECVGIDAATGREIPRSYVSHLEDRVAQLELQLQKHGVELESFNAPPPPTTAKTLHKQNETDTKDPKLVEGASSAAKPNSQIHDMMASVKMGSVNAASTPPSSYLGSSSGLSFARLLFTAVKFKSNDNHSSHLGSAPAPAPEPAVHQKPTCSTPLPPKPHAESLLSVFFTLANSQLPILHREQFLVKYFKPVYGMLSSNVSLASDYTAIGVPTGGGPDTPCDPTSYYAKHYGLSAAQITRVSTQSPSQSPNQAPRPLLDLENIPRPIPNSINPQEALPALYFINIVFGIATSSHQQHYPAHISESFRIEAMKHIDSVLSSSSRLEALQGILLLALYSIMRPAVPGVWYVLGSAMRLCIDLGLHNEGGMKSWYKSSGPLAPGNLADSQSSHSEYDPATLDLRRRLFWCTYALDRQVCVYLGRPVGIPEHSIKVALPSELDDALIIDSSFGTPPQGVIDYSLEKSNAPSYKIISLAFFKIRRLQTEIQQILYDCAPVGRQYASLDEWRSSMAMRLDAWHNECRPQDSKRINCNFNYSFINLNYHQTRLLLFGLCPAYVAPPTVEAYKIIAEAGQEVIRNYYALYQKRAINYTWVAVQNLFMAGTSYLYALYHSPDVRNNTNMADIDFDTRACLAVLTSLISRCDAAVACRDTFELLTAAIIKLCHNEKAGIDMHLPNGRHAKNNVSIPKNIRMNQPYATAHSENLMDSLPRTEIKIEPDLDQSQPQQQQQQHSRQQQQQQPLQPPPLLNAPSDGTLDGGSNIWPEDLDLFFREAAELDGISPRGPSKDPSQFAMPPPPPPDMRSSGGAGQYPGPIPMDDGQPSAATAASNPMHMPAGNVDYAPQQQQPRQHAFPYASTLSPASVLHTHAHAHPHPMHPMHQARNESQRIYEMMTEVPMTSIWDQFFAPVNGNNGGGGGPGGGYGGGGNGVPVNGLAAPNMPVLYPNGGGNGGGSGAFEPANGGAGREGAGFYGVGAAPQR